MIYLELSATCVRAVLCNEGPIHNRVQILLSYSGGVIAKDGVIDRLKLRAIVSKLAIDCRAYGIGCKEVVLVVSSLKASLFKFNESDPLRLSGNKVTYLEQLKNFTPQSSTEGSETYDFVLSSRQNSDPAFSPTKGFAMSTEVSFIASLIRSLNELGLKIIETRSTALGMWRYVSSFMRQETKSFAVLDLGSSFSSGLLVVGGEPTHYFTTSVSSHHVTKDLAYATNLSFDQCEKLKFDFGLSRRAAKVHCDDRAIDLVARPWIEPRVEELLRLSLKSIFPYLDQLDGGIILTGGGARLLELLPFASTRFAGVSFSLAHVSCNDYEKVLGSELVCDFSDDVNYGFEGLLGAVVNRRLALEQIDKLKSGIVFESKGVISSISRWLNILTSTD